MKKNIYTGIFCTILGLCINTPANASIVSSGFLDEKLTEMTNATALQLDLKANQSDFTDLNTQISDSVDVLRQLFEQTSNSYEFVNGSIDPEKFPNTISGAFTLLHQYLDAFAGSTLYGWTNSKGTSYAGLVDLNNGWTDSESNTYLGVKGLNDKIGTLPTKTAMSSCSVWRAIDLPQNEMPETIGGILEQLYSAGHVDSSCIHDGYNGPSLPNIIRRLIFGYNYDGGTAMMGINGLNVGSIDSTGNVIEPGLRQITNGWTDAKGGVIINPGLKGMYDGWTDSGYNFPGLYELASDTFKFKNIFPNVSIGMLLSAGLEKYTTDIYTGPIYPLWKLSEGIDKIGTLPSGDMRTSKGLVYLLPDTEYYTYPTSIGDFMGQMYGGYLGVSGLAEAVYFGNEFMGQTDTTLQVKGLRQITDEIGTLPTEIPNIDSTWARYGFVETPGTPIDLPDTIGEMFAMLFNEDGLFNGLSLRNIMTKILLGFNGIEGLAPLTSAYKLVGDSPIVTAVNANTAKIGTVPDGKNLAGMISETDAKIGTLPTEYPTVGAALTAIKGIAEDAKAAALAAIPDPKTEGSNGKYVLTVDIVGDNATYRWEPIDRGDTTPTTE